MTAAQLLSEGVATQQQPSSFAAGFDWAAEQLRQAGFEQLAAEVSARPPFLHGFIRAARLHDRPRARADHTSLYDVRLAQGCCIALACPRLAIHTC